MHADEQMRMLMQGIATWIVHAHLLLLLMVIIIIIITYGITWVPGRQLDRHLGLLAQHTLYFKVF
jgi:hypothetical protein